MGRTGAAGERGRRAGSADECLPVQSNQYSGPVLHDLLADARMRSHGARPRRPRRCTSAALAAVHPRSRSPLRAWRRSRPALAALADELSEVKRLHHAGQPQAALRARRPVPRRASPKDAQMRFLQVAWCWPTPAAAPKPIDAAAAADAGLSRAGRAAQQPRGAPRRRRRLRQGARRAGSSAPPQPALRDRAREPRRRLCHARGQRLWPRAAARAAQRRPAAQARAGAPARRAAAAGSRPAPPAATARLATTPSPRNGDLDDPDSTRSLRRLPLLAALALGAARRRSAQKVKLATSAGDIVIELDAAKAPKTVDNFLQYVQGRPLRRHRLPPRHRQLHDPGRRHDRRPEGEADPRADRPREPQRPDQPARHASRWRAPTIRTRRRRSSSSTSRTTTS